MRFAIVLLALFALGAAPATQPAGQSVGQSVKKKGPSAASLATPYSGPLKFDRRVLAAERKASLDLDPIRRAATWRYFYSAPCYWWGFPSCGFYGAVSGYAWRGEY